MDGTVNRRMVLGSLAAWGIGAAAAARAQQGSTMDRIRAQGVVRIGWAIYYPNVFRDPATNELAGVMIDYVALLGRALGVQVEWIEDNTATLIAGLQANKFDLTSPLGITPPRAAAATFPHPLLREGLALLAVRSRIGERSGWDSYDKPGTKISVTLGSNSDLHVTRLFTQAEIVRVRSESESLAQVLTGRVDAKAIGRSALQFLLKQRSEIAEVPGSQFQATPMSPALRKGDTEFAAWLDDFAAGARRDGSLLAIMAKYGLDDSFIWPTALPA